MAGHKSILDAVKAGDTRIVEMSRAQARDINGLVGFDDTDLDHEFIEAIDEAQGEADEEGLAVYVVLKINGGPI